MRLFEFVYALRRKWLAMLLIIVICTGVVAAIELSTTKKYKSTAQLFFKLGIGNTVNNIAQATTYTQGIVVQFAALATSPKILDAVRQDTGVSLSAGELAKEVTAHAIPSAVILAITVNDTSPQRAAKLANALANEISTNIGDYVAQTPKGTPVVVASVLSQASAPSAPATPKTKRNVLGAFLGGILLAIAWALISDLVAAQFRKRRSQRELEGPTFLGTAPPEITGRRAGAPSADERAASYAHVWQNVAFAAVDQNPLVAVVSAASNKVSGVEAVIGLANASANAGNRTLVVDGDLRSRRLSVSLDRLDWFGLSDSLVKPEKLDSAISPLGPKLDLLPAGAQPPNPAELLESEAMAALLQELKQRYDVVLVLGSSLLAHNEPANVASNAAGVVLIAEGKTGTGAMAYSMRSAAAALRRVAELLGDRRKVLGVVGISKA